MLLADAARPDGTWPDDDDPGLSWSFPPGLTLRTDADGTPALTLARWRDAATGAGGGLLHLELDPAPVADGRRAVALSAARWRLVTRAGASETRVGGWADLPPAGSPLVAVQRALTPDEAQLLGAALDGAAALEVLVQGRASGGCARVGVLAVVDLPGLLATLPPPPWPPAALADAVAAAGVGRLVALHPLDGADVPPDAALRALGRRVAASLPRAAEADPWTPLLAAPPEPPAAPVPFDLRTTCPAQLFWEARWSVSEWASGLTADDRARSFPTLAATPLFGRLSLLVVAQPGLDADAGLRELDVHVVATGPGGVPERQTVRFTPGAAAPRRLTLTYPAWTTTPQVSATAQAVLAPRPGATPPWPRTLAPVPVAATPPLLTVTAADLGLAQLAVSVTPEALALAGQLRASVSAAGQELAAATLAGPQQRVLAWPAAPDAALQVTGRRGDQPAQPILSRPLAGDGPAPVAVTVTEADLLDLAPLPVTVTLDDPAGRAAYAAVTLRDAAGNAHTASVAVGRPVTWPCRRPTLLDPLAYAWQFFWIPTPDAPVAGLQSTPWQAGTSPALLLSIPGPEEAPC